MIKVTLPAMILASMPDDRSNPIIGDAPMILLISFAVYGVSFLLSIIVVFILRPDNNEKGVIGFITIFSNVGFMGYPVLESIFGKDALFYAAIYNIPFNILVFTLGIYLLVRNKSGSFKIRPELFINPPAVAAVIGLVIVLINIKLPNVIKEPLHILGEVTTPLSMIVIGGLLTHIKLSTLFTNWRVYAVASVRLLFLPLLVLFVLRIFIKDNALLLGVPVIIAAMPAAANTALLAEEYNANPEFASQTVFITTMISIVSIPLIASLF